MTDSGDGTNNDDAVEGDIVDDQWGTAPGWKDDEYIVDETAPKTPEGRVNKMSAELRRLTRNSLLATIGVALLFAITDAAAGHGFDNTTGFVVGGGLATLNLWMLAGGFFAVVDGRAVAARVLLATLGSMGVLFGVALWVIFA
ncbi:MAG TPA: hypothetical protein VGF99_19960, partial [Myxococcota bacterium]